MKLKRSQWDWVWQWIEPMVTIVVGIILYFPLKNKDLAGITWVIGFLQAINSLVITRKLKEKFEAIDKLSEIMDLSQKCSVNEIGDILRLYLSVTEEEFRPLKTDVLSDARIKLSKLAHEKISDEISGGEYYMWMINMIKSGKRGERICAVSKMPEATWVTIPSEDAFLKENIEAAKRGVTIDRIFISTKDRLRDVKNRVVLIEHINNSNHGLKAHIVWVDDIMNTDPMLYKRIREGFIIFYDRVMFVDTIIPPDSSRGYVSMDTEEIKIFRNMFSQLMIQSKLVTQRFFKEFIDDNTISTESEA